MCVIAKVGCLLTRLPVALLLSLQSSPFLYAPAYQDPQEMVQGMCVQLNPASVSG